MSGEGEPSKSSSKAAPSEPSKTAPVLDLQTPKQQIDVAPTPEGQKRTSATPTTKPAVTRIGRRKACRGLILALVGLVFLGVVIGFPVWTKYRKTSRSSNSSKQSSSSSSGNFANYGSLDTKDPLCLWRFLDSEETSFVMTVFNVPSKVTCVQRSSVQSGFYSSSADAEVPGADHQVSFTASLTPEEQQQFAESGSLTALFYSSGTPATGCSNLLDTIVCESHDQYYESLLSNGLPAGNDNVFCIQHEAWFYNYSINSTSYYSEASWASLQSQSAIANQGLEVNFEFKCEDSILLTVMPFTASRFKQPNPSTGLVQLQFSQVEIGVRSTTSSSYLDSVTSDKPICNPGEPLQATVAFCPSSLQTVNTYLLNSYTGAQLEKTMVLGYNFAPGAFAFSTVSGEASIQGITWEDCPLC